jgi:hypothetical protein
VGTERTTEADVCWAVDILIEEAESAVKEFRVKNDRRGKSIENGSVNGEERGMGIATKCEMGAAIYGGRCASILKCRLEAKGNLIYYYKIQLFHLLEFNIVR